MIRHSILALTGCSLLISGCATTTAPMDFAAHQERLEAKRTASTRTYEGYTSNQLRQAAHDVLNGIDAKFQIALTDNGLAAARGWSSYMGFSNLVGTDYWAIQLTPADSGVAVSVNAFARSGHRGPLDMAIPDASGLIHDIPLSSEGGLAPEEMDLFHQRLQARLEGRGSGPTCDEAFGARKRDYALTCNRGGVTAYF